MFTPGRITAFAPIQISSPIVTGFVDTPSCVMICKIVIKRCNGDTLCEIYVIADFHRADDSVVQTNSCMITDNHVAYGIINTAI